MKKVILSLIILCTMAITLNAQTMFLSAYQKNRLTNTDSSKYFNPEFIVDCYVFSGKTYITYDEFKSGLMVEYTVRESQDSILKLANRYTPNLIKIRKAMYVGAVDSFATYLYNIHNVKGVYTRTTAGLTKATSKMLYKYFTNVVLLPIVETKARFKVIVDSTNIFANNNSAGTRYDTATLTMGYSDKHIILSSTTDDTLVLLSPCLYLDATPLVVANISTGTYTLTGGFTVKDKSGSTVSLLAANTVYTFKAYYNGTACIWLKEY